MIKFVLKVYGCKYDRLSYWYIGKSGQTTRRLSKTFVNEHGWDDFETADEESNDPYYKLEDKLIAEGYSVDGELIDIEVGDI